MRKNLLWTVDLLAVVLYTLLVDALLLVVGLTGPVRVVAALPVLLFLPGYALVSAMYPKATRKPREGITPAARVAIAVAASIALVPMVALVSNFTAFGIHARPVLLGVSGVTVTTALIGLVRRSSLPETARFDVGTVRDRADVAVSGSSRTLLQRRPLQAESRFDATLNRFIVVSMLVLVASVAFAGVMSPADQSFSEFYLLTENDSGDLVLADYPNDFGSTADDTLHLGIENHEGHGVEYTVVVVQQRVDDQGEIATQNELDRLTASVGAGESTTIEYTPRPSMTGDGTRVQFLLYRDAPPENPTPENAYRELHVWNDG